MSEKTVSLDDLENIIYQVGELTVHFKSFIDGVFTYEGRDRGFETEYKHEFCFSCNGNLHSPIPASDIEDLDSLKFISHRVFKKSEFGFWDVTTFDEYEPAPLI